MPPATASTSGSAVPWRRGRWSESEGALPREAIPSDGRGVSLLLPQPPPSTAAPSSPSPLVPCCLLTELNGEPALFI
jgi:hypothetical protein